MMMMMMMMMMMIIIIIIDFLAGYNKQLVIDLDKIGIKDKNNLIRQCQKWVISQNCEIVKAVYSFN